MNDWAGNLTLGLGWVYYDGPVGHTEFHRHYAVQICFPMSGSLRIETVDNDRSVAGVLVIGSNVSHRLSSPSPTAKLLYLDPNLINENAARLRIGDVAILDLPRPQMKLIEGALSSEPPQMQDDFGRSIARLIWPGDTDQKPFLPLDPRIGSALADIELAENLNMRLDQLVRKSGLSADRFRHLFSAQVGMPLKSYLLWVKLQRAIESLVVDRSLTHAAHIAGFADSAHLSRTFRRTFGLAPADLSKNAQITGRNAAS